MQKEIRGGLDQSWGMVLISEQGNWKKRIGTVLVSGWKQRMTKQDTWTHTNSGWSFCSKPPWSILKLRLVLGSQKGRSNNSKLMCHKRLRQRVAFTVDSRHSTVTEQKTSWLQCVKGCKTTIARWPVNIGISQDFLLWHPTERNEEGTWKRLCWHRWTTGGLHLFPQLGRFGMCHSHAVAGATRTGGVPRQMPCQICLGGKRFLSIFWAGKWNKRSTGQKLQDIEI